MSRHSAPRNARWSRLRRAVRKNARVIIFDEPTATLTPEEKHHFFELIVRLKERGVAIVFISHALEEALTISDKITVLRDGQHVITDDTANFDRDKIIRSMVGRTLSDQLYNRDPAQRSRSMAARCSASRISRWAGWCAIPRSPSMPGRLPVCSG